MGSVKDQITETLLGSNDDTKFLKESKATFMQHALKNEETGEYYLNEEAFTNAVAPEGEDYHKIKRSQYAILFRVADTQRKGRISLQDWAAFANLLAKSDAEYEIAFRLFDINGTGVVSFDEFQRVYNANKSNSMIPFDWNSGWANLYVGGKRHRHGMTYHQFAQMMRGIQGERIRQAFHYFDRGGDGYIEPKDFQRIIVETAGHKLSDHLLENLHTLCNMDPGSKVSYSNVRAFQNVIREMDMVELIVQNATSKSADGKITRADFLDEAARTTRSTMFTPMEADILFHFAGLDETSEALSLADFARVLDATWQEAYEFGAQAVSVAPYNAAMKIANTENFLHDIAHSIHHFLLGSVAGAFGAFMVYPIDLVKTRMQNQRSQRIGEQLYKNSIDCARKVIRNEGFKGLYSGVLPQLVGVAPEKAIKLTMNDLVRGKFTDPKTGAIWWPHEVLAGACAGASQVMFTNPLEIVKIRLQIQGEMAKTAGTAQPRTAWWIVKNLGLVGLYKGASACLLRDVPFSAIYFPSYNHLKRDLFGEGPNKKLGILQLLTAGAIAGMPAAYLTTPCDVIKTRLQVEARKGEQSYTSLRNCAQTIYRQEGFKAFFKGGPARILRSSPQFGFTLAGYELLQGLVPLPVSLGGQEEAETPRGRSEPGVGIGEATAPLPYLRSRKALKIILDLDQNFGQPRVPEQRSWLRLFSNPTSVQ